MKNTLLFSVVALALTGCATVQLAPERLQSNQASIRGAQEVGAESVPAARLHLQLAKDQTASATQLAADGDDRAEMLLAREVSVHNAALKAATELKALKARPTP
jgi:hypothetical protein